MTFVTSMLANRDDVSPRYINLTANQLQQLFPPETGASNVAFVNLPGFDPDNKVLVANNTQSIIERIVRTYPSQLPARRAELAKRFQGVHEYARLNGLKFLYSNSAESQRLRKIMSLPEGTHAFDVDYGRKLHKLMNLSPMSPNSPLGDTFFRSSPFGLGCFRDPTHPECNFAKLPEVAPADLIKRFENLNIDPRIGTKICQYWYQDLLFNYFNSQTLQKFPNRETMLGQCMEHVQKYGIGAYFKIDRVIKTYQATAANIQVHPWSSNEANISVGTNYSLQENFSDGYGSSFGLSVSRKMFEVFGAGFSGSFGVSWSRNEQVGGGNNASISTGTQVKVQQVILPVKIEKYQRCVSVRLNPKLFFKDNFSPKFNGRSGILSDESYYNQQVLDSNRRYENTKDSSYANTRNLQIQDDLRKFRRMGFLACSEQVETAGSTPFIVNELYSRIWQDLNNDGILDKGYRNNLKYNFSLRGRNDFRNFIVFAKASVGGTGLTIAGYQNAFPSAFFPGEDTSIAESERLLDFSQSTVPGFFVTPLTK